MDAYRKLSDVPFSYEISTLSPPVVDPVELKELRQAQADAVITHGEVSRAEDYPHLLPDFALMVDLPKHKRISQLLSDVIIRHTVFSSLLNQVHWLVSEPRGTRAMGVLITSDPGSGKTALAEAMQRAYPRSEDRARPKALMISVSGVRTTKTFLNRILACACVPVAGKYTIGDQELTVLCTLRRMDYRLLILDEVQDLLNGNVSEQVRVHEAIKYLMNMLQMPVVALGTNPALGAFRADPHLAARFEAFSLPTWQEGEELANLLHTLEATLPLKKPSHIARPQVQKVLLKQTGGVLDQMLRRIKQAAVLAVVDGTERITIEALERDAERPPIAEMAPYEL